MLKTIRRYYWLTKIFFQRHSRLILKTTVLALIFSFLAIFFVRYLPAPRHTTRVGLVGKFTFETLPVAIQRLVSTGLVTIDDQGNPQPSLAKSWQIKNDGKEYIFFLNDKIKWHDHSSVKPTDITYNFREVSVTYGDNTVIFDLKEPFSPFFNAVTKPILKDGKLGTGEFQIIKSNSSSNVLQSLSLASVTQKLIYKFYPTESSALTAYKLGEVDRLENISYLPPDVLSEKRNLVEPNLDTSRIAVVFFNNNDVLLSSKSTRQGLAYAIEDKSFGFTRALSPVQKDSWAYNSLVKTYDFDPEKARTLFTTDVQDLTGTKLELKTTLQYLDQAESIASSWRAVLGIQVSVKVVTNIDNNYQALLADYAPPTDPDQYTIWHSTQSTNFTHYANLKVDKLLEDGRRTLDKKLRLELYQDFQRFLLEDCPAVFLYNTSGFNLSRQPLFK